MLIKSRRGQLARRLQRYLTKDKKLQQVVRAVKKDFAKSGLTAHNWEYIWRDTLNAIVIGEAEKADMSIVLPATVMHDIGFLYGASGKTHGKVGAKKLPLFLKKNKIFYSSETVRRIASCINTHKGSMHAEKPETLEAKVVADADMLEKFGLFGVYQYIRTYAEFDKDIETIIESADLMPKLYLETKTGRKVAQKGRGFVVRFFKELDKAYEPYKE